MPARIESVASEVPEADDPRDGRTLAGDVSKRCLEAVSCRPQDVGLIVYAGVYRDEHLMEPAHGPFVQDAIGANPEASPLLGRGTFSFDVGDLLSAVEVAAGFLDSERVECALVVGADARCVPRRTPSDPETGEVVPAAAGALLLLPSLEQEGFQAHRSAAFPRYADLVRSRIHWIDDERRHEVVRRESPEFPEACAKAAEETARTALRELELVPDAIDLLIASPSPAGFPTELARRLGIDAKRVADAPAGVRSAGPIIALDGARRDGRYDAAERILFVTASPGLQIELALYEKRPT